MAYVYVCEDWFPAREGLSYDKSHDGFPMEEQLKMQIDFLVKNAPYDWNFIMLICGDGEMRVGKSLLEMQIGCYWAYQVWKMHGYKAPFTIKDNLVFNGEDLIPKADALGSNPDYKCAFLGYDEAADDLESTKVMKSTTQSVKDYLRKAAQYNMLTILVQAEFFEVPRPIALSRSTCMINVKYFPDAKGILRRGYFEFYSKRQKKLLYLYGKKELNYQVREAKPDFYGHFPLFYPLPEQGYREEKAKSLKRWKQRTSFELRMIAVLKAALEILRGQVQSCMDVANMINQKSKYKVSYKYVERMLQKGIEEDVDDEDS